MNDEPKPPEKGAKAAQGTPDIQISKPVSAPPEQPATENKLEAVEHDMDRFSRLSLRWTRATFGVVAATGLFISLQWCEMRSQGEDTRKTAEVAIIQNRPWIGFEPNGVASEPLVINEKREVSTFVSLSIKNFGNVPGSVSGTVFANLVIADGSHGSDIVSTQLRQQMASDPARGTGPAYTLFPGGAGNRFQNTTFVLPIQITQGSDIEHLMAFLVGGIIYTDPVGKVHHTGFSYLYQVPGGIRAIVFGLEPGKTVAHGVWVEYRTMVD